jgi:hypothetical protein
MTEQTSKTQPQKPAGGVTGKQALQKPENKTPVKPVNHKSQALAPKPSPSSKSANDLEKRIQQLWNDLRDLEKKVLDLRQKIDMDALTFMLPSYLLSRILAYLDKCERSTGCKLSISHYVEHALFVCLEVDEEELRKEQEED